MRRFPDWQLFVTVLSEAHSASEVMWHAVDAQHPLTAYDPAAGGRLLRVFQAMDRSLAAMLRTLRRDDTVFVFSLDGMRASHGDLPSIVLLPELLHRERFGTVLLRDPDQLAWRRAGYPPLVPRRGAPWRHDLDRRLVVSNLSRRQRLQRLPIYESARSTATGRRLLERVKRTRLGALGVPIPAESDASPVARAAERQHLDAILFAGIYRPYWARMRAFALPSFGDGYLRINVRGRERDGRVGLDEFDDERRALDALVRSIRDPRSGLPVSDGIDWITGSSAAVLAARPYADGVVRWTRPVDAFEVPGLGMIGPFPLHRTGTHADPGFLWASGPGIEPGRHPNGPALDLPPMILAALDQRSPASAGTPTG